MSAHPILPVHLREQERRFINFKPETCADRCLLHSCSKCRLVLLRRNCEESLLHAIEWRTEHRDTSRRLRSNQIAYFEALLGCDIAALERALAENPPKTRKRRRA